MLFEASVGPVLSKEPEFYVLQMGHIKKVLEDRPVAIFSDVLNMLPDPTSKAAATIESYWTEGWLRIDLASSEVDVAEFLKKYDHANHAQEVTAKALADANSQRDRLVEKMAQLEDARELLKAKCSSLKEKNHELEQNTDEEIKAGMENF
ncbi:hypothetical protein Fot_38683 [Forsythia ovata]|uniref:Uncharacterized protein n=1 Tax=Forsythia ovata TaxID=205694 RepID=A0ABD1S383_9LAMI